MVYAPGELTRAARKTSYLDKVEDQFLSLYLDGQSDGYDLGRFVKQKLAESYWNGVAAGARGVEPKQNAERK